MTRTKDEEVRCILCGRAFEAFEDYKEHWSNPKYKHAPWDSTWVRPKEWDEQLDRDEKERKEKKKAEEKTNRQNRRIYEKR